MANSFFSFNLRYERNVMACRICFCCVLHFIKPYPSLQCSDILAAASLFKTNMIPILQDKNYGEALAPRSKPSTFTISSIYPWSMLDNATM